MRKLCFAAAIAAIFICSCNKEEPARETTAPVTSSVVKATAETPTTKAELGESGSVLWVLDDKIAITDANREEWAASYTVNDVSAGSTSGTFTWNTGDSFKSFDTKYSVPAFESGKTYSAYSPSELVRWDEEYPFIWKTVQTYAETCQYIPMAAEAVATDDGTVSFHFNNLGGILKLTVKGTATIKSIKLEVYENLSGEILAIRKDENGNFVADMYDSDCSNVAKYIILDCGDGVKLSKSGTDFYFSLPCSYSETGGSTLNLEDYYGATFTLTDIHGNTCVKKMKNNQPLVIERSKITQASFTAEFKVDGALTSKFTVNSEGKQVYFAAGNLYWDGDSFEFETDQFSRADSWDASHVSHFYWSSKASVAYTRDYSDQERTVDDQLFTNATPTTPNAGFTANSQTGLWRTLSYDEWNYLIKTREVNGKTGIGNTCSYIEFGDVEGYVIFCDDYTGSTNLNGTNEIPDGCVFLRSNGYRGIGEYESEYGIWANGYNGQGAYWLSCPSESDLDIAGALTFGYGQGFDYDRKLFRSYGFSIRLVTDVE